MTPQQIMIKCAELCGWKKMEVQHGLFIGFEKDGTYAFTGGFNRDHIPNYPEDKNACQDFYSRLSNIHELNKFTIELGEIICRDAKKNGAFEYDYIFSTALQLCEAFLRTKGEWKE